MPSVLDFMLHYIIICVVPVVPVQVRSVKCLENEDLENGYLENEDLENAALLYSSKSRLLSNT